jgi:preprotein translocase subunit SecG
VLQVLAVLQVLIVVSLITTILMHSGRDAGGRVSFARVAGQDACRRNLRA